MFKSSSSLAPAVVSLAEARGISFSAERETLNLFPNNSQESRLCGYSVDRWLSVVAVHRVEAAHG